MQKVKPDAWIGIDPGTKGFICLLVPSKNFIAYCANKLPPTEITKTLTMWNDQCNIIGTYIEKVHAIKGTAANSMFSFGYNTGLITGIVQGMGLSLDHVTPKTWQRKVGIPTTSKNVKKDVASKALSIYPYVTQQVHNTRNNIVYDKTDSLMIAHFARLTLNK